MSNANIPAHVAPDRVYDFDMYADPRLMKDLHEGFAEVTRDAPAVFWAPQNGGHWVINRMDVAEDICRDYEYFSTTASEIPRVANPHRFIPLSYDPPKATPFRAVLMPYFSPKTVAGLEDKIRGWAVHFIDAIKDDGRTELVKSISSRFPVTIFMEMMGIPFEKFDLFRTLAEDFFSESTEQRRHEISDTIYREMEALIDARAVARTDDLMQILVDSQIEGRPIARDELKSIALLLFLAGLDTLVNVISFSYRELAKRPDLQDRLRKDPSQIPAFVEEGLRMFGVVNVPRIVLKDTTRHGVTFKEGDMVLALISQFGRDPRENPDPTVMDLDRENRRLMPFSTGPHLCLGHHLTRTEMRILTEEWLKRIPHFAIADGYEPSYRAGLVMALKSLSLTWDVSANRALDMAAE